MLDVVLFVYFLVDFSSEPRQNDLLEKKPVSKPNYKNILNDSPAKFSDDVAWISEDSPSFSPKIMCFFGMGCC
jgi:hypothetical protein